MNRRSAAGAGMKSPVVRSSFALIVNTGLNAVLGFAYWVAAARLLPSEVVGAGAAGVSSLLFVASLGWAGMQFVLLRYIPTSGRTANRLVGDAYAIAVALAVGLGIVFLVVARNQEELAFLVAEPLGALVFLGAVAIWVVFSLQDAVLVGIGRAAWVPVENLLFGLLKLTLLVALTQLVTPWALLVSWVVATIPMVIVVTWLIRGRAVPHSAPELPPAPRLARFWGEQQAITILVAAPDSLVPLMVLAVLGPVANAHYYAAWTVSFSLRLMVVNIGSAMTAESARRGVDRAAAARHATRLAAALITPVVVGTLLLAPMIMQVFGEEYRAAADALRLFGLGLVPFAFVNLFIARRRVAERGGAALVVALVSAAVTLAVDAITVPAMGITGAGVGWLIGWSVAAVAVLGMNLVLRSGVVRSHTA